MTGNAVAQLALFVGALLALAWPLGAYLTRVYAGEARFAQRVLGPLERAIYRLAGVRSDEDQSSKQYALAVLAFSLFGVLLSYLLLRLQGVLPLNPTGMGAVPPELAFNTATSFVTNTNWQAYGGETTMSHLTQMVVMTVQNFVSAGTGMAVMVALVRGFTRESAEGVGNFWVDLTRSTLYVLLPLSFVFALVLVSVGVVQTLAGTVAVHSLDGAKEQLIAIGPVASQEAIKLLGTNGGGFFNVNSAHPFENPTALSNLLEMLSIFVIPAASCLMFGRMVKDSRQGFVILAAMLVLFVPLAVGAIAAEQAGNPALHALGADIAPTSLQAGGNMEGKEVRFGVTGSALLVLLTALVGVAYPLAVTGAAQVAFPAEANGSLVEQGGRAIGSELIGQRFEAPGYFWGRPSATSPQPYNGAASTGSNLGPTNPALTVAVHERVTSLRAAHPDASTTQVPIDLVTSSGSGLDPHISPAAALYQVRRVAHARALPEARVRALVEQHIEGRTLGVVGEARVNVLRLNLALDELARE